MCGQKHATGPSPEPVRSPYIPLLRPILMLSWHWGLSMVCYFLPLSFLGQQWTCSFPRLLNLLFMYCGRVIGSKVGLKIDRNCLLTGCRKQDTGWHAGIYGFVAWKRSPATGRRTRPETCLEFHLLQDATYLDTECKSYQVKCSVFLHEVT
jgi:hypothetical protein